VLTAEQLQRIRPNLSRRNRWTRRVRARILVRIRHYPVLYVVVAAVLLPGGFVLVPVIAWWYRRRRDRPQNGTDSARLSG
jgi:hypothetical protein